MLRHPSVRCQLFILFLNLFHPTQLRHQVNVVGLIQDFISSKHTQCWSEEGLLSQVPPKWKPGGSNQISQGSQRDFTSNKGFSLRAPALGFEQISAKQSCHWSVSNCLYTNTHITLPSWNSPIKDKLWQAFKYTGKLSLSSQWDGISLAPGPLLACRASLCKLDSDVLSVDFYTHCLDWS